jgi:hypothetical protein
VAGNETIQRNLLKLLKGLPGEVKARGAASPKP